jgi:hypothetical protein
MSSRRIQDEPSKPATGNTPITPINIQKTFIIVYGESFLSREHQVSRIESTELIIHTTKKGL